jgi:hypothetical protein
MISASAGTAYATKGNILWPGSDAEAALVQAAAAPRANEVLKSTPNPDGGAVAAPSIDSGDLVVISSNEAAGSRTYQTDH